MMEPMERCWNWMMSFGPLVMPLGAALIAALIVLVVVAIVRLWPGPRRP